MQTSGFGFGDYSSLLHVNIIILFTETRVKSSPGSGKLNMLVRPKEAEILWQPLRVKMTGGDLCERNHVFCHSVHYLHNLHYLSILYIITYILQYDTSSVLNDFNNWIIFN